MPLAPELDRAVLIGLPVARSLLRARANPAEIYVRTAPASVTAVAGLLPATADPAAPQDIVVTNPADALIARADASTAFQGLFLALGAVALVVGGVGIANAMVIAVLERRGEIGLRRALGATRVHIAAQSSALAMSAASPGRCWAASPPPPTRRPGTGVPWFPQRRSGRRGGGRPRGWCRGRASPRAACRPAVPRAGPPRTLTASRSRPPGPWSRGYPCRSAA